LATTANALHVSCPLCGGSSLKPRWDVGEYHIVGCDNCSLVFVKQLISANELAAHYAQVEDPSYQEDNSACLDYYHHALRQLIERSQPLKGRLLDIGCSGGFFLDTMTGWECYGNEISKSNADTAKQKHGDRIFNGPFEEYPLKEEYFDVITLQDVFDHMRDPVGTLDKCHAMLKPGGLIVVKVHNISCLYAKVSGKRFYAVVPPSHLFYYDESTLERILGRTGFRMIDSRFIAHLLRIHTILLRLSQGNTKSLFYKMYERTAGTWIGKITVKKNLHDVITVLAIRE
jgi:2-polyprenyl-3-methyl-5-hydroxy-6-metoxy-1,4-benzoquinol methylase